MTFNFTAKPTPWQLDVLNGIKANSRNSIHVVKSARQLGKTSMLEMLLLKTALTNQDSISIAISPTLTQSIKLYKEILKPVLGTQLLKSQNGQRLSITFYNGAEILFKSGEQKDALRGFNVRNGGILVLDEAAFLSDEVFYLVQPFTNVSKAPIILTSTPLYKLGFFYDHYMLGLNNTKNVYAYDWTDPKYDTSEFLSPEVLDRIRKQVPISTFMTDYLGQFLDLQSGVFGDFSTCFSGDIIPGLEEYIGIDWASNNGGDYTSICVVNSEKQITDLVYFNDLDSTQTIKKITDIIKEHSPKRVLVEQNSIGSVYLDLLKKALKREGLNTILSAFNTTNDSKYELVSDLQVYMNNAEVRLIKDDELVKELMHYQTKPSSTGKPTFNAESGFHDDLIMSLMLALRAMKRKESSFLFV